MNPIMYGRTEFTETRKPVSAGRIGETPLRIAETRRNQCSFILDIISKNQFLLNRNQAASPILTMNTNRTRKIKPGLSEIM